MTHKPILHIYQHGDQFFAALPDFVDLQESEVVWLDGNPAQQVHDLYGLLCVKFRDAQAKKLGWAKDSTDKNAAFERAKLNSEHPGRWNKRKEFAVKEEWGE